ncbi:penicillin acylase family protein [Jeotgalibacillus proteolyticus]|uniref:penicillin acylase family protein n=1 Tax=Jeotgalibacillus proteolyticus TaxID=2082395 RepID=UPI003CE97EBE
MAVVKKVEEQKIVEPKQEKKIRKWQWWVLGVMLLIGLVLLIGLFVLNSWMGKSEAVTEGELSVSALDAGVTVTRDDNGVPHINAESDADLYRAQGFVQAQDRMFQMDLARRQASGRLAEVVGEAAVETDRFFRTFSLRHAAEISYDGYGEEAKQVLAWYAEGVNAYMETAKEEGTLPFEFSILGYEPEPWSEVDSLTIGKYMAYDLSGNWSSLAFRHWAVGAFPEDKARELFITYPENAPAVIEANKNNPVDIAFGDLPLPPEHNGSNNWVVSGDRTESGEPLLADDPHLGLSTPSIWYQMHLTSPEQNVSGVIFAGIPGIILGHNDDVAWGVTNVGPDVQDLYIEKQNPENKRQFWYDGKWEEADVRDEPIKVKDGETVDYRVVTTRHGPIISPVIENPEDANTLFSMQWTALEPTLELQAVINMNKAENWEEFEKALEDFHSPAQNFVFAAKDGTIAYKANGRIPIRKSGDGQLPVPGDSTDYEWSGYVPYDELPTLVNPEEGFIATANNAVVDESYPNHITDLWAQPYRYKRIVEVLEENDEMTVDDMMALQMDIKNLYAEEFLDNMIQTVRSSPNAKEWEEELTILEEWDRMDDKESAGPLLFHRWMKELPLVLFEEEIPKDAMELFRGTNHITDQMMRDSFSGDEPLWVKDYGSVEAWLGDAFDRVVRDLSEEFGEDPADWRWGDYHQVYFEHPLSSASPVLAWLLNREGPIETSGSQITVQAQSYGKDGIADHGGAWRFVADVADLSTSYHLVGPGQSGHVKSDWYHDQIDDWIDGTYHETVTDPEKVEGQVLELTP